MKDAYDVMVIGGGTAGAIAAIQAARAGASVLTAVVALLCVMAVPFSCPGRASR